MFSVVNKCFYFLKYFKTGLRNTIYKNLVYPTTKVLMNSFELSAFYILISFSDAFTSTLPASLDLFQSRVK